MELRQLRYLIAVNEESTFVKAAERLHLAQPALSRQIQNLEKELGAKIFIRGRTGVSLTPAGAICVGAARSLVRKADAAIERTRMAEEGRVGMCAIFASQWAMWSGFSARLVAYLATLEPDITISLEEAGPGGQWGSVRDGTVDIAIATKPFDEFNDLVSEPLIDDIANMAVLGIDHPLAQRESLRLEELEGESFLTYDATILNYADHDVEGEFLRSGFVPKNRRYFSSAEGLMAMVIAGFGWSIHRRSLSGKIPNVAMVPIENFALGIPVTLVRRANRLTPVMRRVVHRMRELAREDYPELYVPAPNDDATSDASPMLQPRPNKLELRDLRYFVAAVENKTIGRAATSLGISQPALSRQLRDLEADMGVELLERSPHGVTPTLAGRAFLADAKEILADAERLPVEVARGERAVAGKCVIGSVPSGEVQALVARVVASAASRYPEVDLHIQNIATPLQPAAVQAGTIDFGICHPFPGLVTAYPDLECYELLSDEIDSALVSVDHPLAKRDSVGLDELSDIPFLFFRREFHPAFHDYLMDVFRAKGFRPREGAMQEGLQTMWALTAAGEGWSLGFGRQRKNPPRGLAAVPITGLSIPWGAVLVTRRDESRPIALAMIDLIHQARPQSQT